MLIDKNLEVACVRLCNQAAGAADCRVQLDGGLPVEQGLFYRRLFGVIQADDEVRARLSGSRCRVGGRKDESFGPVLRRGRSGAPGTIAQDASPGADSVASAA
jgi:hypothetical protein